MGSLVIGNTSILLCCLAPVDNLHNQKMSRKHPMLTRFTNMWHFFAVVQAGLQPLGILCDPAITAGPNFLVFSRFSCVPA